jgi:hypothetical protein
MLFEYCYHQVHLPIVPETWKMKPNAKTKKQLTVVKGLLQKSNNHIRVCISCGYPLSNNIRKNTRDIVIIFRLKILNLKHKAVTYPRSDCQYLPISQLSEVKDVMTAISSIDSNLSELIANATNATNADLAVRSKVWNDKKLSAHHAIIPTDNMQVNVSDIVH